MPSVLVELGFLTHKKEEDFLNSNRGKNIMTKSLFNATTKYLQSLNLGAEILDYNTGSGANTNQVNNINNDVKFKIQIAASSKALDLKPYNFKGLNNISRLKEGSLYKYYYGETSSYEETKILEENAKNKGYSSSFIVAFKNGKKIALAEALKTTAN